MVASKSEIFDSAMKAGWGNRQPLRAQTPPAPTPAPTPSYEPPQYRPTPEPSLSINTQSWPFPYQPQSVTGYVPAPFSALLGDMQFGANNRPQGLGPWSLPGLFGGGAGRPEITYASPDVPELLGMMDDRWMDRGNLLPMHYLPGLWGNGGGYSIYPAPDHGGAYIGDGIEG